MGRHAYESCKYIIMASYIHCMAQTNSTNTNIFFHHGEGGGDSPNSLSHFSPLYNINNGNIITAISKNGVNLDIQRGMFKSRKRPGVRNP